MHRCPISNKYIYIYKVLELEKERKKRENMHNGYTWRCIYLRLELSLSMCGWTEWMVGLRTLINNGKALIWCFS